MEFFIRISREPCQQILIPRARFYCAQDGELEKQYKEIVRYTMQDSENKHFDAKND
jgi:hypothetical protein